MAREPQRSSARPTNGYITVAVDVAIRIASDIVERPQPNSADTGSSSTENGMIRIGYTDTIMPMKDPTAMRARIAPEAGAATTDVSTVAKFQWPLIGNVRLEARPLRVALIDEVLRLHR